MAVWKVAAHLCLTLIIKELNIRVEHGRVVTTPNILFCVVCWSHDSLLSREVNGVLNLRADCIVSAIAYTSCSK